MSHLLSNIHLRFVLSGALSGVASVIVFTIIHDIFISNIWSMLIPMLIAGALCGALVGWSYNILVSDCSIQGWIVYNLIYVVLFCLLGLLSVLIFEPVTTMASVVNLNGPPTDLIDQAMPMTIIFTIAMAVFITIIYRPTLIKFTAVLITCIFLIALLGLNVSAIGLVSIPVGSMYLIGELVVLIVVLNLVYVIFLIWLEKRHLGRELNQGTLD